MKVSTYLSLLLFILAGFCFSSCSDDDENPPSGSYGPQNVFTGELPKSVGISTLKYNSAGLLEEITNEYKKITFRYPSKAKSTGNNGIIMQVVDLDDDDSWTFSFDLGDNGFIRKALQTYSDNSTDTWEFGYNNDGQLNYMKRSEGDNKVTNITYANGNISGIKMQSDDVSEGIYTTSITYTSDKHSNGIENKGCLMLFDITFGIDMDEMEYAYYAGLLGRATKKLPLKMTDNDDDEYEFDWTLNEKGYPTQLICKTEFPYELKFDFNW